MSADRPLRESPLRRFLDDAAAGQPPGGAGVVISEHAFLGHVNLRGSADDAAFTGAAAGVLGFALPTEPNTVSDGGGLLALWLGPDEWLIVTPPDRQAELARSLEEALGGVFASVTDVTGGQTVIRLSGAAARDVLAKGCTLDLHPSLFGPGRCAQTLVAKANAAIRYVDDAPSFDLIVRRSFAEYLALWLHDAALEYGAAVAAPE